MNRSRRPRFRPAVELLESRLTPSVAVELALGIGGAADEESFAIATDSAGNVVIAGWMQGTVDFDPGPGTASLTTKGLYDSFVAKYSSAGALLWAKQMGGTSTS